MDNRRKKGRRGEDLAAEHLASLGYVILVRNYRCKAGEVDIIARDGPSLVFVEVKSRTTASHGSPREAVNPEKQRRISLCALDYLKKNGGTAVKARFDVVTIVLAGAAPRIEVLKNAFELACV
jgi:putative endonuclease